jgi:hypothetical protein
MVDTLMKPEAKKIDFLVAQRVDCSITRWHQIYHAKHASGNDGVKVKVDDVSLSVLAVGVCVCEKYIE